MYENVFTVEVNKSFNVESKEWQSQVFIKLYVSMFRSGLVSALGNERTITLLAIASYMDEDGACFPTQEQLAELMGISRPTVNKYVNSLLEFRWNGKPIIERQKHRNPKVSPNEYSVYTVLPLSQVAIFDGQPGDGTEPAEKPKASDVRKAIISHFCNRYRETYGEDYSVRWARDMKLVAQFLRHYTGEEAMEIVDVVFQEFESRWAAKDYPRPSIGQLATWLHERAAEVVKQRRAVAERFTLPENDGRDADELARILGGGAE